MKELPYIHFCEHFNKTEGSTGREGIVTVKGEETERERKYIALLSRSYTS
jgi:hypothetical protein